MAISTKARLIRGLLSILESEQSSVKEKLQAAKELAKIKPQVGRKKSLRKNTISNI